MLQSRIVSIVGDPELQENSEIGQILQQICKRLALFGFSLRTSGTIGTELIAVNVYKDLMDKGQISPSRLKIYLPWQGYNTSVNYKQCYYNVTNANYDLCSNFVRTVHAYWHTGTKHIKLMHAKNALIIFGDKLNKPTDLLIVCSKLNSKKVHGTDISAVELALAKNIPVFNLYDENIEDILYNLRSYLRNAGYPVIKEEEVIL